MAIPSLDERIVVHAPPGAQHAIERAAIHAHLSPAQFLRQLVMDGLRANGFELARSERVDLG